VEILKPEREVVRVMLVDDHEVVRNGIRALVSSHEGLIVVAEASTAREAVDEAERAKPDVIVMDIRLPDGSGIEATREIRSRDPDVKVLMLTSFADDEAMFSSILAGASGYVLKQIRGSDIVASIAAVGEGKELLSPDIVSAVQDRVRRGKHFVGDSRLARLSPQEERILELIAEGKTNAEIAANLELADKTVKNYVSNVLRKLEVGRRAQAAAYIARHAPAAEA
jgi:two-component system, NarL family, response regulator DevR